MDMIYNMYMIYYIYIYVSNQVNMKFIFEWDIHRISWDIYGISMINNMIFGSV